MTDPATEISAVRSLGLSAADEAAVLGGTSPAFSASSDPQRTSDQVTGASIVAANFFSR